MEKQRPIYEYGGRIPYPAGIEKLSHIVALVALAGGIAVWALVSYFRLAAETGYGAAFLSCKEGFFVTLVVLAICAISLAPLFRRRRKSEIRFAIYAEKTVVHTGAPVEILHGDVVRVCLERSAAGCAPVFETADGKRVYTGVLLPSEGVLCLKKVFGERVSVERAKGRNVPCARVVLGIAAGVFAAGIAVTAVGCQINKFSLALTGAIFLAGGCILACIAFERVMFVKEILLPFVFGCVFFCFPTALGAAFTVAEGATFAFSAFLREFCFSGFYCVWVFLTALGAYFLLGAGCCLVRFLRYARIK